MGMLISPPFRIPSNFTHIQYSYLQYSSSPLSFSNEIDHYAQGRAPLVLTDFVISTLWNHMVLSLKSHMKLFTLASRSIPYQVISVSWYSLYSPRKIGATTSFFLSGSFSVHLMYWLVSSSDSSDIMMSNSLSPPGVLPFSFSFLNINSYSSSWNSRNNVFVPSEVELSTQGQ